jgi:hypothetical protein
LYQAGWNLFSYPVQATRPVAPALASIDDYYTVIYGYVVTDTLDPWRVYGRVNGQPAPDWVNDLKTLEFGHGYWIHVTQAITLYLRGASDMPLGGQSTLGSLVPPATYFGAVWPDTGFGPEDRVTVQAWVNGKLCGQAETQKRPLDGVDKLTYAVKVPADDDMSADGCGAPGRTVTFKVGGKSVPVGTAWDNRRVTRWELSLDPHVYLPQRIYLPLIYKND